LINLQRINRTIHVLLDVVHPSQAITAMEILLHCKLGQMCLEMADKASLAGQGKTDHGENKFSFSLA
jgi:hypothetical protein